MASFDNFTATPLDVPGRAVPVVPSDAQGLAAGACKALYVGGGGDIAMRGTGDGAAVLWKSLPAGALLPFRAEQVLATGTTATHLLALY